MLSPPSEAINKRVRTCNLAGPTCVPGELEVARILRLCSHRHPALADEHAHVGAVRLDHANAACYWRNRRHTRAGRPVVPAPARHEICWYGCVELVG